MNYLAKMRVLTVLLNSLGKYKSKTEVKLRFMWKNYFLKLWIWESIKRKKKNYNINVVFYLKQITES